MKPKAFNFEAKKAAFTQSKGGYFIKLELDPLDMPTELATDSVGQRYMVALAPMSDFEADEKEQAGDRAVQLAGIACRTPDFWFFLKKKTGKKIADPNEEWATDLLKALTRVGSRAEYKTNEAAREKFYAIFAKYETWLETKESDPL